MKKRDTHINEEDFRRYLDDKMSETERNRFERELQKNPFESEAMTGFQNTSSENLEKDIAEIKSRLKSTKRHSVIRYWAAAASVLLLVIAGLFWYQLNEDPPIPEVAQLDSEQQEAIPPVADSVSENLISAQETINEESEKMEAETDVEEEPIVSESADETTPEIQNQEIAETQEQPLKEEEAIKNKNPGYNAISARASKAAAAKQDTKSVSFNKISEQLSSPVPAGIKSIAQAKPGTIVITERAGFPVDTNDVFPDSFKTIPAEERERIQEIQGVAIQDQVELEGDPYLTDIDVRPEGGMTNYMNYINKQAVLPEGYSEQTKTVKLVLSIDSQGEVVNIESSNKTDSLLLKHSIEIIQNGPDWNPKIVNGERVQSEVKLEIIFKKK